MVCLYFGSFNPFHKAHLALACYALKQLGFTEVWLILSPLNPQKDIKNQLPYELRREIILDTIEGETNIKLVEIERNLPRPLYTIRTVQALKLLYPHEQFSMLIGSDNLLSFSSWHRPHELLKLISLFVYPRPGYPLEAADPSIPYTACLDAPQSNLSASSIRQALDEGKEVAHLLASPHSETRLNEYWHKRLNE
ncbi:MAG: nicotinate (nicotinamide) nucleotide adenylyltransferase [Porphyromonas sp.]